MAASVWLADVLASIIRPLVMQFLSFLLEVPFDSANNYWRTSLYSRKQCLATNS